MFGLLPVVILGIISSYVSSSILERELNKSAYQTLEKASINVGSILQRMSDLSDLLTQSMDTINYTKEKSLNETLANSKDKKTINETLKSVSKFLNFPTHIYLIDKYTNVYSNIQITGNEEKEIFNTINTGSDYAMPSKNENRVYWLGMRKNILQGYDSNYVYYIARNIMYKDEYYGTIYIGTGDYILSRMLDNIKMTGESRIFVFDQNNQFMADTPEANNTIYQADKAVIDGLVINQEKPQLVKILNGVNSVTFLKTTFDWKIAMLTPLTSIRNNLRDINRGTVIITIISALFILLSLFLVDRKIVKPIIYLSNLMKIVRKGNLEIRSELKHSDEIGILSDGFNKMLVDFNKMLEKIHADEILEKELEFKVLQAQISPHFLYNTLNSIRWMAEMNNETKVGDSIVSLVRMMEYNTKGNNEKFVTLSKELQYVKEYIYLQSMRYWNRFDVSFEVDECYYDYIVLKLSLQPIIENSIIHGLNNKKGKLFIKIACQESEGNLIIVVSDNGAGINSEVLSRLNSRLPNVKSGGEGVGIGLCNVNDRIKLEFGENYGINISSIPGEGTAVKLVFPLIKQ